MLLQWPCRRSPYDLTRAHDLGRQNAAAGAEDGVRLDARLVPDPYLSADHGVVIHHHTAGEPGLRRHDDVPSDPAVVAHMHHVIELRSVADVRSSQRRAV